MSEPELFSCDGESYTPAQVLAAAAFWGELDTLYLDTRRRLNALQRARRDGLVIPDEKLQAGSEAFRRARGLRTVHATEAWMAQRGVTVEQFSDFLEREALCACCGEGSGEMSRQHPAHDTEAMPLLWPDAVFTGSGDVWCQRLAVRVAAATEVAEDTGVPASLFDTGLGGASEGVLLWLAGLGLGAAWRDRMRALEAAHAYFAAFVQTPARLDAALRARWSTLFAIDIELGGLATEAAAREACLCVTEDGAPIEEVCARAGGQFHRGRVLLGDLPETVRAHALSVPEGSFLPIFTWENRFMICRVLGKSEPTLDDARIREVVEQAVLDEAVQPLVQRHITWPAGIAV